MENILLILELFSGIILIFGLGCLISHLIKLDKYFK